MPLRPLLAAVAATWQLAHNDTKVGASGAGAARPSHGVRPVALDKAPSLDQLKDASRYKAIEVKPGDTLGRIAARHGIPLQTLYELNAKALQADQAKHPALAKQFDARFGWDAKAGPNPHLLSAGMTLYLPVAAKAGPQPGPPVAPKAKVDTNAVFTGAGARADSDPQRASFPTEAKPLLAALAAAGPEQQQAARDAVLGLLKRMTPAARTQLMPLLAPHPELAVAAQALNEGLDVKDVQGFAGEPPRASVGLADIRSLSVRRDANGLTLLWQHAGQETQSLVRAVDGKLDGEALTYALQQFGKSNPLPAEPAQAEPPASLDAAPADAAVPSLGPDTPAESLKPRLEALLGLALSAPGPVSLGPIMVQAGPPRTYSAGAKVDGVDVVVANPDNQGLFIADGADGGPSYVSYGPAAPSAAGPPFNQAAVEARLREAYGDRIALPLKPLAGKPNEYVAMIGDRFLKISPTKANGKPQLRFSLQLADQVVYSSRDIERVLAREASALVKAPRPRPPSAPNPMIQLASYDGNVGSFRGGARWPTAVAGPSHLPTQIV